MLLFLEVHNAPPAGRRFEVEGLNLPAALEVAGDPTDQT